MLDDQLFICCYIPSIAQESNHTYIQIDTYIHHHKYSPLYIHPPPIQPSIYASTVCRMHLKADGSEAAMLRSYAKLYVKEIVSLLGSVPSELLLVFKTSDCLRHLDKILHSPVNTMIGMSMYMDRGWLMHRWGEERRVDGLWCDDHRSYYIFVPCMYISIWCWQSHLVTCDQSHLLTPPSHLYIPIQWQQR